MPRWLSLNQACDYLGVSRPTIYRMCQDGRLAGHALPGIRGMRFLVQDLEALPNKLPASAPRSSKRRGSL
jgi:excisionase family DNA binding protein